MRTGQILHCILGFQFIDDLWHCFKVIFISIVKGCREKIIESLFKILLDVQAVSMGFFIMKDISYSFFNLLDNLFVIKFYYCFSRLQKAFIVFQLAEDQF